MQTRVWPKLRVLSSVCLVAWGSAAALGQEPEEADLFAKQRILAAVGPGLRAVRQGPDGRLYVLASPSPGLLVVDRTGKPLLTIGEQPASTGSAAATQGSMAFGDDCDVDGEGRIYVADRGANLIRVFSPDGAPLRSFAVKNPVSVAVLEDDEVAVATLGEPHLVMVFDKNGKEVREFGDPESIAERAELNRFLNIGQLATDKLGHLYYGFEYWPEPTVRQYDQQGYAGQEIQYAAIDALPTSVAVRKEIDRQEKRRDAPSFKRVLTALGVERSTGEVWMALANSLLHFDTAGNRRATYKIYTPEGARLEANTVLVEKDQLIIGGDPLGLYLFDRPDKKKGK